MNLGVSVSCNTNTSVAVSTNMINKNTNQHFSNLQADARTTKATLAFSTNTITISGSTKVVAGCREQMVCPDQQLCMADSAAQPIEPIV